MSIIIKRNVLALSTVVPLLMVLSSPTQAANVAGSKLGLTADSTKHGMLMAEHDIFVGRAGTGSNVQTRGLGMSSPFSTWTNGLVPYQLEAGLSQTSTQTVLKAIAHWNENSSITLYDHTASGNTLSADYIGFTAGPGCASWVGRQGNDQEVWVADACTTGSMIHEIGHALGLLHEHTRSDRDQYLEVKWENIQSQKTFNFELGGSGTSDLGEYDYGSIMHYGEYFFSANGTATLVPTAGNGVQIGQRVAASEGDLSAIDHLYASDLSLITQVGATGEGSDATFTVSNLRQMGAHGISVNLNVTGGVLRFSGDAAWNCAERGDQVACELDVLPGETSNSVTVSFDHVVTVAELASVVTSKTFDVDLSNNGGTGLLVGSALGGQADNAGKSIPAADALNVASATGGGSLDLMVLMLMLVTLVIRQRHQLVPVFTR